MSAEVPTAILLISCPDQPGLVSQMSHFIHLNNGNIVHLDQHVDFERNVFFMRLEWTLEQFNIRREDLPLALGRIAEPLNMNWELYFSDVRPRIALFVTTANHCLYDILAQHEAGDLPAEIPLIVSNRDHLKAVAERFGIPFFQFSKTPETREQQEEKELQLLEEHHVDTVILARYMQILSPRFVQRFPHRIINVHHSFLPAFIGARPYHQAYARGVKLIGATSHYVTEDLDEGPIIDQDVSRVSHKESVQDFIRSGRALEKSVLSRAVWLHVHRKILTYDHKTVIFV